MGGFVLLSFFLFAKFISFRAFLQNQLLACLKWLGEFQITAYVPLNDSISLDELAELADVPEHTLSRVVRMTATAGFLHEPQLGCVAHTPLSLAFTNELLYFDAAMFLANKVAPSALDLTPFEQKQNHGGLNMAGLQSFESFATHRAQEPQLNRQWLAYCHSVGNPPNDLGALINLLNWQSLGDASVVHVSNWHPDFCRSRTSLLTMLPRFATDTQSRHRRWRKLPMGFA